MLKQSFFFHLFNMGIQASINGNADKFCTNLFILILNFTLFFSSSKISPCQFTC